jgi:hypothetical protein
MPNPERLETAGSGFSSAAPKCDFGDKPAPFSSLFGAIRPFRFASEANRFVWPFRNPLKS